jgi:hypothetical protein
MGNNSEGGIVAEIQSLKATIDALGQSISLWNNLMIWGFSLAAFFTICGIAATKIVVQKTEEQSKRQDLLNAVEDRQLRSDLRDKELKIQELSAGNLDMRYVVDLRRHVTGANPESIGVALNRIRIADLRIVTLSVPDSEPRSLLSDIWQHLSGLGWKEAVPLVIPDTSMIRPGVEIWTLKRNISGTLPATEEFIDRSWSAGEVIAGWLRSHGIQFVEHKTSDLRHRVELFQLGLGYNTVLVLIGDRNMDGELGIRRSARAGMVAHK